MKRDTIAIKRIYVAPRSDDGARYLVDRFWPRAVKKEDLRITAWLKEVAPSNNLRRWFGHDPMKWDAFKSCYRAELDANPSVWQPLLEACRHGRVTLLYAARDRDHNNAIVLKEYLEERIRDYVGGTPSYFQPPGGHIARKEPCYQ